MIKNINVSTKITLLILGITLVAVGAISFFSYDYHQKTVQQKNVSTLTAMADNYAAYFNHYFDRASLAAQVLKTAPEITRGSSGAAPAAADIFAVSMDVPSDSVAEPEQSGNSLEDFLHSQKT